MAQRAGKLRHFVTIENYNASPDSIGEPIKGWIAYAQVWASIEPLSGTEFFKAQQMQAEVTNKILIRPLKFTSAKMRVVHGTDIYDIQSVLPPKTPTGNMVLMAMRIDG